MSWLKGFKVGSRTTGVRDMLSTYVDDTIVFCDAISEQISFLRLMLFIFEAISGLKINWRKNNIFPINEVTQFQVLANILRCGMGKLPTSREHRGMKVRNLKLQNNNLLKK
ncbi:hypothetical protein H5410_029769 [Solanum commersonii]|uniref:Reverse transcriptase domain-containing protein n=1 Tax=Solanum commersonii TaxID=4109 RepID=A0A9J5YF01_SOLCO|nr:hypothetical protein H5410_029769 [Solanum commersonii]